MTLTPYNRNAMRRTKTYAPPIIGIHSLPDGMRIEEFDWGYLSPKEVREMHVAWREKKDEIDREWLAAAEKELAAATESVDEDKRKLLVQDEIERRQAYASADAAENAKWVAAMVKAEDDAFKRTALARVRKVGNEIRQSDAAARKK